MVIVNSGHASGLKKCISLLPFVAECVYSDRESIFLKPFVVDILGMLEKDLSEVASVATVIWFDTHIAKHTHTHPHFHKYSGRCRRHVCVSHSFMLNYGHTMALVHVASLPFDPRPCESFQALP